MLSVINADARYLRLRGHQQFYSRTGLQIFLQMMSNILHSSLRRSVRVPPDVITFRKYAARFLDVNDPSWRLSEILIRICELQVSAKDGPTAHLYEIVNGALDVDNELSTLSKDLPMGWEYKTVVSLADPDLVYAGTYHIYPDLWVAHLWNSIRAYRITLHQIIHAQIGPIRNASPSTSIIMNESQEEMSWAVIQEMSSEICATIPQYAGYVSTLSPPIANNSNSPPPSKRSRALLDTAPIPDAAFTYFLLWQLLKAGEAATSSSQREWLIHRLQYLGSATGIYQAFAAGNILKCREKGERQV